MKALHHLITDEIDDNDYLRIIFDISHSFQREELVIVPRTKGGFSYGYVDSMKQENRCPFNYGYEHNSVFWTIKFYHTDTKTSRKTLPASKIGKLSSVPRKPNGDEGELSPEEYRHVVYDEEAVLQSTTVVCPSTNGGLIYCIGVLPKPIKCKCGDHMIDGLIVENGVQEMAFPLSAVGVILTDDLRKRIVIDGADVAYYNSHGNTFEVTLLLNAIDYYEKKNYEVTTIIDSRVLQTLKKQNTTPPNKSLNKLIKKKIVTSTNISTSNYSIEYAMSKHAVILSNENLHDKISSTNQKAEIDEWLKSHQISFMFDNDLFIPNPDFKYPFN
ncbi:hypothetical protein ENU1_049840 [Entamoeba nuttalli P19]|uniref:RNase NYN domain-containing protein n=1 Tax=Entamoeba nuttalli (strain P19) TaxID=1076696 RepID=K2HFL6_ENTNP|nr:hypothetical protein ENU1_049840 [Entamoeba nuttalli P19]EKE41614.1 hypothetical protein ENU1_049840 [Entamoeba nuttalli P19]|eukprot:XP_008856048.1 hypothetical protein ENU1_049840 [Entamoeba nuttalli P19]